MRVSTISIKAELFIQENKKGFCVILLTKDRQKKSNENADCQLTLAHCDLHTRLYQVCYSTTVFVCLMKVFNSLLVHYMCISGILLTLMGFSRSLQINIKY